MLTVHLHQFHRSETQYYRQPSRDWTCPLGRLIDPREFRIDLNGRPVKDPRRLLRFGDELDVSLLPAEPLSTLAALVASIKTLESALITIGTSLVLTAAGVGIQLLLAPDPNSLRESEDSQEELLRATTRTAAGSRLPLVYGTTRVGMRITEQQMHTRYAFEHRIHRTNIVVSAEDSPEEAGALRAERIRGYFCSGPAVAVSDIRVNGNKITDVTDVTAEVFHGHVDQGAPDQFDDVETVGEGVASTITNAAPVVWNTSTKGEGLVGQLHFPQGLGELHSSGTTIDYTIELKIEFKQSSESTWSTAAQSLALGASQASPMDSFFRISGLPLADWDVRVSLLTTESEEIEILDEVRFERLSSFVRGRRAHPGIVLATLTRLPETQLTQVTDVTAVVKNHDDLRIYTDPGKFSVGHSDNPAWCQSSWMADPANGLGQWVTWDRLDIPSLIEWAEHNDQLIDGERRNVWGGAIDAGRGSDRVLLAFSAVHDCAIVDEGGFFRFVVDRPRGPVVTLTEADVIPGTIDYDLEEVKDRALRLTGKIKNEENDYAVEPVTRSIDVIDAGEDFLDEEIELPGIQRVKQAERQIWKALLRNWYTDEALAFESDSPKALKIREGDVFGFAHSALGDVLAAGRIMDIDYSTGRLRLDRQVDLTIGGGKITIVDENGNARLHTISQSDHGESEFVTLEQRPTTPRHGDAYAVAENAPTREYVCQKMELSERNVIRIRAVTYDDRVYDPPPDIFDSIVASPTPQPKGFPDRAQNVKVEWRGNTAWVSWTPPPGGDPSLVQTIANLTLSGDVPAPTRLSTIVEYEVWIANISRQVGEKPIVRFVGSTKNNYLEILQIFPKVTQPGFTEGDTYRVFVVSVGLVASTPILSSPRVDFTVPVT